VRAALAACDTILATLGDWERRNRLGVMRGMADVAARDFGGVRGMLGGVATFTAHEVIR
jgi:hypothetical protein